MNKARKTPSITIGVWMIATVLPANVLGNGWAHVAELSALDGDQNELVRSRAVDALGLFRDPLAARAGKRGHLA